MSKTQTPGRLGVLHLIFRWLFNPDFGAENGWLWNLVHEALRVLFVGVFENLGALFGDSFGIAFMDISWSHEHNVLSGGARLVKRFQEELGKELPRLFNGFKSLGEVSSVLQGLELGL